MSCENEKVMISAYLDGELSSAENKKLKRHLAGCASCRKELAALKALSSKLQPPRTPELWSGIAASLDRPPRLRWRFTLATALLLTLILGAFFFAPRKEMDTQAMEAFLAAQAELLQDGIAYDVSEDWLADFEEQDGIIDYLYHQPEAQPENKSSNDIMTNSNKIG